VEDLRIATRLPGIGPLDLPGALVTLDGEILSMPRSEWERILLVWSEHIVDALRVSHIRAGWDAEDATFSEEIVVS